MFDQLFNRAHTINRHSAAPLLDERLSYLTHCGAQGITRSSLRTIAAHLLVFIDYLDLKADGKVSVEQINAAADLWVSRQPQPKNVTDYRGVRMSFISNAKQWLRFLGRLRPPEVTRQPYADMIEEFNNYMTGERGLASRTIRGRC